MPARIAAKLRELVADLPDPEIVIIGVAYKSETNDMRESPSIHIGELLRKDGYRVRQYDPLVEGYGYPSLVSAAEGADLLAILVPHGEVVREFGSHDREVRAAMRTPRIITF